LSTAITKDGQTTTTSRILFAQGISSTLVTDATSATTGSIITAGGISTQKALWVGTTSRLVGNVQADGLLGIGMTPVNILDITKTQNAASIVSILNGSTGTAGQAYYSLQNSSTTSLFAHNSTGFSSSGMLFADGGLLGSFGTGGLTVGTLAAYPLRFGTNGNVYASITSTGLFGIGMTPSNVLDVAQSVNTSAAISIKNTNAGTAAAARFQATNGTYSTILDMEGTNFTTGSVFRQNGTLLYGDGPGGLTIDTGAAQPIYFGINNNEVARIGTDGSFLVGGTTNGGVLGNAKFAVLSGAASFFSGTLSGYGAATYTFSSDNSSDANCVEIMQGRYNKAALTISGNNTGTITAVQFYDQGVGVGTIATTSSATAYNTSSDARLKTNVSDAAPASALIDAIQVRQFDWKVDSSHQRYGMVAQELLEVAPEAVSVPTDPEQMMGVDYSKLVPMMIKTIQELTTRLAALEAK
jgi:hypothetical protein